MENDARQFAKLCGPVLETILSAPFQDGFFIVKGGRVTIKTIREQVFKIEKTGERETSKLADQLDAKEITVDKWLVEMKRVITSAHILAGALACGSIRAAIDSPDVQKQIKEQMAFLEGFAKDLR